ncbi:Pol polyprotein [Plakobranchus ocellatus]|uniref:Pol polyprotein n=1 Tax=Plakobranchus ocellatus TaxID=259542 RepID=A0AAV4DWQ9_9GAST|nr:Pol polyprotein [Plakobranchus ocellatus]
MVHNRCHRCNRTHGPHDQCPAMGKTCHICSKPNHFTVACRSVKPHTSQHRKNVNDLMQLDQHDTCTDSESDSGEFFLNCFKGLEGKPWTTECEINGKESIIFKIDTDADVTVVSRTQYKKLKGKSKLEETGIHLYSPGGPIKCSGKFSAQIRSVKGVETKLTVYVVETRSENLLGRGAIQALDLVSVNEIITFEEVYPCQDTPATGSGPMQPIKSKESSNSTTPESGKRTGANEGTGSHRRNI